MAQATATNTAAPAGQSLAELLRHLPEHARQRQDSTNAQLETVESFLTEHGAQALPEREKQIVANRLGAYDAADIYKLRASQPKTAGS